MKRPLYLIIAVIVLLVGGVLGFVLLREQAQNKGGEGSAGRLEPIPPTQSFGALSEDPTTASDPSGRPVAHDRLRQGAQHDAQQAPSDQLVGLRRGALEAGEIYKISLFHQELLGRGRNGDAAILESLAVHLGSEVENDRRYAAQSLAAISTVDSLTMLLERMQPVEAGTPNIAVAELGKIHSHFTDESSAERSRAQKAITTTLENAPVEPAVFRKMVRTLLLFGDSESVSWVLKRYSGEVEANRKAIRSLIPHIYRKSAVPALAGCLADVPDLRVACADALAAIGEISAVRTLVAWGIETQDPERMDRLVTKLGAVRHMEGIAEIGQQARILEDAYPDLSAKLRTLAVKSHAQLKPSRANP